MYMINGHTLPPAEVEKISLPCLVIDVVKIPIREFQLEAIKRIVTDTVPTKDNLQLGVAYCGGGKLKWVGSLAPNRIQFILNLLDHLDTHLITEEYGVLEGNYIDAYKKEDVMGCM